VQGCQDGRAGRQQLGDRFDSRPTCLVHFRKVVDANDFGVASEYASGIERLMIGSLPARKGAVLEELVTRAEPISTARSRGCGRSSVSAIRSRTSRVIYSRSMRAASSWLTADRSIPTIAPPLPVESADQMSRNRTEKAWVMSRVVV
jgi:hypothetical protein